MDPKGALGGEAIARFDPPGLAFIAFDGVRLLLEQAAPPALIYLRVADVRKAIDEMRDSGVTIDTEPHRIHVDADGAFGEPGWEEWMAFIRYSERASTITDDRDREARGR